MRKKIRIVTGVVLAWFIIHSIWIVQDGLRPFTGKADVAVVLGNTVYEDGSLSPWLKGRVDAALKLYQEQRVKKIFVSGGTGEENFPEGDAMRTYLLQHGVDSAAIIADNGGANSYLTAKDFIEWNKKAQYTSAVIVTSYYHITRCKYIFRKLGFTNIAAEHSTAYFWQDMIGLAREFPAFYKYMLIY